MRNTLYTLSLIWIFVMLPSVGSAALISEFTPNPPGLDSPTQTVEISGLAGNSFTGFLLGIGGEFGRYGIVDSSDAVSGTFNSSGLFTTTINDLFNPTHTLVLVTNFTGTVGTTDIDANDDGMTDNIGSLIGFQDAIGVPDSMADQQFLYGSDLGGQDFAFTGAEPTLVFRDASVGSWYAINNPNSGQIFDIGGENIAGSTTFTGDPFVPSFGFINPSGAAAVPEPGSMALLGLAGLTTLVVKRRQGRKTVNV